MKKRFLIVLLLAALAVFITAYMMRDRSIHTAIFASEEERRMTLPDGKTELPDGIAFIEDVQYGKDGGKPLYMDILRPSKPSETPLPVIIGIHGGGWSGGSKSDSYAAMVELAQRGYFCATIDYRLVPEAMFPDQIQDCKCAVRFLRSKKQEYNIDPERFGVWGVSAGGYLAALLGTSGGVPDLEGKGGSDKYPSNVQAAAVWYAYSDLTHKKVANKNSIAAMLGSLPGDDIEKAKKASPVTYASKEDPPFLIMHGDKDTQVPLSQSKLLYDALKNKGADATLRVVEGAPHSFRDHPECYTEVYQFFDKYLKEGNH